MDSAKSLIDDRTQVVLVSGKLGLQKGKLRLSLQFDVLEIATNNSEMSVYKSFDLSPDSQVLVVVDQRQANVLGSNRR